MQINITHYSSTTRMNSKYMVVIAAMAVMLIGATAFATDSAFAGGHGHKKSYEKNQATSQVNECGNGFMPYNVGCQNTASQIQGNENGVSSASAQEFDD
ncbi:MAG: hypothetical protein WCF07_12955 [Nitrososphaeraceae archaeon]